MDRHAVINQATGEVIGIIIWDGITKWSPPEGHRVVQHEDCARGDIWIESLNDFVRPLSMLKAPEDDISIAQRKSFYEECKRKLKVNASFMVLNDSGQPEKL